ncbi:MAG: outer membrane protein assembly factor BamD [Verrucomicrobia bacterium]|nr:outer membrane protein assembly factor BamD [Verrucomicrobiota bacterium]
MKRWLVRLSIIGICWFALPREVPAPLVYRAGEGWTYEPVGGGKWTRTRAKDQLEVAQTAFDQKDYSLALKAARRTVRVWPLSDYAPQAQYLLGRCYEAKRQDERAFKEYQRVLEKYPKIANYDEILNRQYEIANRYLGGQWFKLWGHVPFFPSMEKTSAMYEKVIRNGPYSEVAAQAQMNIGAAREKQSEYPLAVKAYERAADKYHDQKNVGADALYKAGLAYRKQAKAAEYDQSVAGQAISTFTDFMTLYPNDSRVPEAQKIVQELKTEQARGSVEIARFYEKKKLWQGALVYYNEAVSKDPNSSYAKEAKRRIEEINKRTVKRTAQN